MPLATQLPNQAKICIRKLSFIMHTLCHILSCLFGCRGDRGKNLGGMNRPYDCWGMWVRERAILTHSQLSGLGHRGRWNDLIQSLRFQGLPWPWPSAVDLNSIKGGVSGHHCTLCSSLEKLNTFIMQMRTRNSLPVGNMALFYVCRNCSKNHTLMEKLLNLQFYSVSH